MDASYFEAFFIIGLRLNSILFTPSCRRQCIQPKLFFHMLVFILFLSTPQIDPHTTLNTVLVSSWPILCLNDIVYTKSLVSPHLLHVVDPLILTILKMLKVSNRLEYFPDRTYLDFPSDSLTGCVQYLVLVLNLIIFFFHVMWFYHSPSRVCAYVYTLCVCPPYFRIS